ncbi:magnesium transporter MgtC [archaeon]|nr:magnesium transporter MgtC [archaeon]|tara:strand:- start:1276 stop:1674 length:399 start_codon:yes stop_codon:yes gene_type:complete
MALLQSLIILRLFLALILGAILGFEHGRFYRPAGIKVHVLVSIGAAMVTLLAIDSATIDLGMVILGILVAVGLLGVGIILNVKNHLHGVTSAVSLWIVGLIGIAAGVGQYLLALIVTFVAFIVLEIKPSKKR